MTILFGLLAACLFGVGDLIAGVGGRRDGSPDAPAGIAFVASLVGMILSGLYVFLISDDAFTGNDIWWALAAGVLMSAARPMLYRGMARGPIVVFAPVIGVTALVVPAILGLTVGQSLGLLQVLGVLVALPAIVFLSSNDRLPQLAELRSSGVVMSAVVVGSLIGVGGLFLSFISDGAGAAPAFVLTGVGILVVPVSSRALGLSTRLSRITVQIGTLVGCTSILAIIFAVITYQRGNAAIGSALIGLSPGVSLLLAWRFLSEQLWKLQVVGALLGAAAIVLFSLGQ